MPLIVDFQHSTSFLCSSYSLLTMQFRCCHRSGHLHYHIQAQLSTLQLPNTNLYTSRQCCTYVEISCYDRYIKVYTVAGQWMVQPFNFLHFKFLCFGFSIFNFNLIFEIFNFYF